MPVEAVVELDIDESQLEVPVVLEVEVQEQVVIVVLQDLPVQPTPVAAVEVVVDYHLLIQTEETAITVETEALE